jgi:poly-beta-hydroxybutyrate-responsive repressor
VTAEAADPGPIPLQQLARPPVLIRPFLLLLLGEAPGHGYDLVRRLRLMGYCWEPKAGGVYHHLRCFEREGLVRSTIDTGRAGPARRMYSITAEGTALLSQCGERAQDLSNALNDFIRRYQRVLGDGRAMG